MFKFRERDKPVYTSDVWYCLNEGGYINPHDLLEETKQADEVHDAIEIIRQFLDQAEDAGVIEYY